MTEPFKINTPGVVHEMIDGEVVIVNLDTGRYYSLDNSGAEIWEMLNDSHHFETVYKRIQLFHSDDDGTMRTKIETFLDQLKTEELIVPAADAPSPAENAVYPASGMLTPFVEPQLNTYTDMEELLLLDPIHEVSDEGWPAKE